MDPYEWDEAKNAANRLKHGIGFELIARFDWSRAIFRDDRRYEYGEHRRVAFGRIDGRGYAIVFVIRGHKVRLISLRPMHEKELRRYDL